jgi:hypothetical protein
VVGTDGLFKIAMKKLAPATADKAMGKSMQRVQVEKAPPGADSPGAVEHPMREGTEVSAGREHGRSPL